MWTDDELMEVIRDAPAVVDDALKAVQQNGGDAKVDLDAFAAAAGVLGSDPARLCVDHLRANDLLAAFQAALVARGLEPPGEDDLADAAGRLDFDDAIGFLGRARTFRCRVELDHAFAGSGCLVGPGLVLTAWHVVRVKGPGQDESAPPPKVSVVLSDGSTHEAHMPPRYASECGDAEWKDRAPRSDSEVADRHDVALLSLRTPAARHLGYAPLPDVAPTVSSRSRVYLLDFPRGEDLELGDGTTWKIRNVTSRLYHDIDTESGSSGGACFDRRFQLLGLHQGGIQVEQRGRTVKRGRLVPLRLFYDAVAGYVARDIAPTAIWHLDGERSQLVIGRDLFAAAVAAAGEEHTPVRGIRIKRRRPADPDERGLGFSYRILVELLMRRGAAHVAVAVPLDEPVADLVGDLAQRVEAAGIRLGAAAVAGPADSATLEGAARDRANRFAAALDEAAAEVGRTVWFFVDNPSVPLAESARLELEAFVAASLPLPRIRLVIAGLETLPLAGLEFSSAAAADPNGPPGLVVDFVGGFSRADVLDCLTLAAEELTGARADEDGGLQAEIHVQADLALQDLADFNGEYADADLPKVVAELQDYLRLLHSRGNGGP